VWRLWLEGKVTMTELDQLSIDDVEAANRALDAWAVAGSKKER
jgi:hypothetical protein